MLTGLRVSSYLAIVPSTFANAVLAAAMSSSASSADQRASRTERSITVAPVSSRSVCASRAESAAAFAASTRA
jgi:hypothetical protein